MPAIQILWEPEDITVEEGDTAIFNCSYTGTLEVPFWYIGSDAFSLGSLPDRHMYLNEMLIVTDVRLSDNYTTYQCSFIEVSSRTAILTVVPTTPNSELNTIVVLANV